jgi:hypothetical protein
MASVIEQSQELGGDLLEGVWLKAYDGVQWPRPAHNLQQLGGEPRSSRLVGALHQRLPYVSLLVRIVEQLGQALGAVVVACCHHSFDQREEGRVSFVGMTDRHDEAFRAVGLAGCGHRSGKSDHRPTSVTGMSMVSRMPSASDEDAVRRQSRFGTREDIEPKPVSLFREDSREHGSFLSDRPFSFHSVRGILRAVR